MKQEKEKKHVCTSHKVVGEVVYIGKISAVPIELKELLRDAVPLGCQGKQSTKS